MNGPAAAVSVLDHIRESGQPVPGICYNIALPCLGQMGQLERAFALFYELREAAARKHRPLRRRNYHALISACCEAHHGERAARLIAAARSLSTLLHKPLATRPRAADQMGRLTCRFCRGACVRGAGHDAPG